MSDVCTAATAIPIVLRSVTFLNVAAEMSAAEFEILVPLASAWVEEQEQWALGQGLPLTEPQMRDARAAGVLFPGRVRVLKVGKIPLPQDPVLRAACDATQAITPQTTGLSVRYGILIREEHWLKRELLVHELVHTGQYERLGGIRPFLEAYLQECLTIGYPNGPMEQEAIAAAAKICS